MGVGGGLWWIGDYCVRTKIDYDSGLELIDVDVWIQRNGGRSDTCTCVRVAAAAAAAACFINPIMSSIRSPPSFASS